MVLKQYIRIEQMKMKSCKLQTSSPVVALGLQKRATEIAMHNEHRAYKDAGRPVIHHLHYIEFCIFTTCKSCWLCGLSKCHDSIGLSMLSPKSE